MAKCINYCYSNPLHHPSDDGQLFILVASRGKTRLGRYLQSSARFVYKASTASGIHEYSSFDAFRAAYISTESDKSKIRKTSHNEVGYLLSGNTHILKKSDPSRDSAFANAWCDLLTTPLATQDPELKPDWFLGDKNLLDESGRVEVIARHNEILLTTGLPASFATMLMALNLDIYHGELTDKNVIVDDGLEWYYQAGYEMASFKVYRKQPSPKTPKVPVSKRHT